MDYVCPRCAKPVARGAGPLSGHFGLVGALLGMAFASYTCIGCGLLARSEFPPEVRSRMLRSSLAMGLGALLVLGAAIAVLVALN